MRVELHCHSTASDGTWAPERVAELAVERQVELFCLTDHDTCAGSAEAEAKLAHSGIALLRGLELSAQLEGRTVHLLVYRPPAQAGTAAWTELEHRIGDLRVARRTRMNEMLARLAGRGVTVTMEQVEREADGAILGRPHLARALVAAGHVSSMREAFDRWLSDRGPAHVTASRLDVGEALEWTRAAGARVSLAHPHTLGPVLVGELLRLHAGAGLGAIEAGYGVYGPRDRQDWTDMANQHGLAITYGSDFHGGSYPEVDTVGVDIGEDEAAALTDWLGVAV